MKDGPGSSIHRPDHHLLRLHNLEPARFEPEKVDSSVARIEALETAVNQKFEALETTMESRFSALEIKVEERLASFESLLRRIALQLNILDPKDPVKSEDSTVTDSDDQQQAAAIDT